MTDYKDALWMPNNNFFANTGKKSFVILHGTAGGSSAQGIANFFQGTENTDHPASTHYIIGQDGTVVQTVKEKDGAYGNGAVTNDNWSGNPNFYTISIEHVKSATDNSNELTEAQKQASFKLVEDICNRNGIGKHDADDTTGITGHFAIDPVSRSRCPGPYPWDELWTYLGGNQPMSQVPTGWTDDGHTLIAPNGVQVVLGFRDHVINANWDANNWPLYAERHLSSVEQSNPALGGGQEQTFRWKRLEYTAARGIFEAWLGQELFWYQKQYAALQTQIALLQSKVADLQNQLDSNVQAQTIAALQAKIAQAQKDLS